ncbi:MAG: putative zinc-binding metallopeptidase, partial [Acidobacteriota bacterium]
MKIFHCDHCGHLLFFENTACVNCGRTLAYLPDLNDLGSLDATDDGLYQSPLKGAEGRRYKLCLNYSDRRVCNWALGADENHDYCLSCRLTEIIPDVTNPEAHEAWYRLEVAKRRLVFTLLTLNLPIKNRVDDPTCGLAFQFKADLVPAGPPVLTGHDEGTITINIAEADDAERARRRAAMHEPYRTLLGHMRHESGHYYWDRLVRDTHELEEFRSRFGNEQRDYDTALQVHYQNGAPFDWPQRFVTAYASAHPWEDWAETWAHYLHILDTLDTASSCGVSLRP